MWSLALSFMKMNENVSGRTMIQTIKYGVSVPWGLWSGTRSFLWD